MNKRIKKKKLNQLTEEEQTVIKLFRECEKVAFKKYKQPLKDAEEFVSILEEPREVLGNNLHWFQSEVGKIETWATIEEETE